MNSKGHIQDDGWVQFDSFSIDGVMMHMASLLSLQIIIVLANFMILLHPL